MKVLLVNGSPRKYGNTNKILEEVKKELTNEKIDAEIFWIKNKPIQGCTACYKCIELGKCAFEDTVNEFVEKMKDADGFIFGTPVHYGSAAGNFISFLDRVFYSAGLSGKADYFMFKPAASVITARRAGTTATYDELNKYFGINQMPIISTRYWNMVFGDSQDPDALYKDEEGIQFVQMLARNMAYYLKCIELGKENGILPPEQEEVKFTNFVR